MNRPRRAAPRRAAVNALAASALSSAVLAATLRTPPSWASPPAFVGTEPSPLTSDLAGLLVVGEAVLRPDLLAILLVLANATAATWAGYQLFRGPGRFWAATAAGPLTAFAQLHWLYGAGVEAAFPALPFTLLGTLAVAALVRSLVHLGHVTPIASTRALACAAGACLLDPAAGLLLLGGVLGVCIVRSGVRHRRHGAEPPDRARTGLRRWAPIVLTAWAFPALMAAMPTWPSDVGLAPLATLHLAAPPLAELGRHLSDRVLYPALALLVLLVLPLRWRGGPTLGALTAGMLVLHVADRPLVPVPAMILALATAGAGWIWLAGSVSGRRPAVGRLLAAGTAAVVLGLGIGHGWERLHGDDVKALAAVRPTGSLLRLVDRALLTPGDVLVAHDRSLRESYTRGQRLDGARPDVLVVDPAPAPDGAELAAWTRSGRRVVSDSFDLGGRLDPRWALDAGPLFWFVGQSDLGERDFTDLSRVLPRARDRHSRLELLRWERMHVERARFRRGLDRPQQALRALPLGAERIKVLSEGLQIALEERPDAGPSSELPPTELNATRPPGGMLLAEAGDLMYARGQHDAGSELLIAATQAGFHPAWAALARWQLRAGEDQAGERTLSALAVDPELREQAVSVLGWLITRGRIVDALALRASLGPAPAATAEEIGVRLALLNAMVEAPPQ